MFFILYFDTNIQLFFSQKYKIYYLILYIFSVLMYKYILINNIQMKIIIKSTETK